MRSFLINIGMFVHSLPLRSWLDPSPQPNNPTVHELTTGPEIIEAVVSTPPTASNPSSGKVDVVVAGAGTGGTITGISRAVKRTHNIDCIVVGVDPVRPDSLASNLPGLISFLLAERQHPRCSRVSQHA